MSVMSKRTLDPLMDLQSELGPPVPWPEWTDAELNAEKWDSPKSNQSNTRSTNLYNFIHHILSHKDGIDGQFLDTQPVVMPASLKPFAWKRGPDLKGLTGPPMVYKSGVSYPDFITNNKHIVHSEFVRWFISTMINLQYCGRNGLVVEGETSDFTSNSGTQCWQGWMHVYSLNKAGKGAQHRPVINPNGKYIVRLYFLGLWRTFVMDDMIPVDKGGKPLLPCTENNSELWPMILAKAMLKLASLSWYPQREIFDFHPITCFTGWICLPLNTRRLSTQHKWDFLTRYVEHSESSPQIPTESKTDINKNETSPTTPKSKPDKKNKTKQSHVPEKPRPVVVFARLDDMTELAGEVLPDIAPCWSHPVYIEQSRDFPLDPSQIKPSLPGWKPFRSLKWAIHHNLISPEEYFAPPRWLKIISPLRDRKESVVHVYEESNLSLAQDAEEELPPKKPNKNKNKGKEMIAAPKSFKASVKLKDPVLPDISLWADFNKMSPHITEIQLFYKSSHFEYIACVSDFLSANFDQDKEKSGSANKESKKSLSKPTAVPPPPFANSYRWQHKMTKSRNEALYLLIDSVDCKFLLVDFSTMQPYPPQSSTLSTEKKNNDDLTLEHSTYLTVERHSWFTRSTQEEPLAEIKTSGSKSTVFELEPGRHLLRIFFRSEFSYFIKILSDTVFHLGNRLTMHELMCDESDQIDKYVKRISNGVSRSFQAFGGPQQAVELRGFYGSYMPDKTKTSAGELKYLHDLFLGEFIGILKRNFTNEEITKIHYALRVFFINPHIGIQSNDDKVPSDPPLKNETFDQLETEDSEEMKKIKAATMIQSFFRMILIKLYKRIHDPSHMRHLPVLESLRKVVNLFDFSKHETVAHSLFRNVIQKDEKLKNFYPCSKDFQHVLHVQKCKGTMHNVESHQWTPIVRILVNPAENEVVHAAIDLFTNLPSYMLRVFNNETGREMLRIVNNVAPVHYQNVRSGYTVFGYGWTHSNKFKELDWTLHMVTMRGYPIFHKLDNEQPILSSAIPSLFIEELSNNYVPNISKLISSWIIDVTMKSVLSFRLRTSYDMVRTMLRILDEEGRVLSKAEGSYILILPLVCLEHKTSDPSTTDLPIVGNRSRRGSSKYYLEAYVLNDSWPLTESDWEVVEEVKATGFINSARTSRLFSAPISKRSEVLKLMKQISKKSMDTTQTLKEPFWTLQVVSDVGSGLEIVRDRRREDEIAKIKADWVSKEPGRLHRGCAIREEFLEQKCIVIDASVFSLPRVSMNPDGYPIIQSESVESSPASWTALLSAVERRTLKKPQDSRKFLPELDLFIYMQKDEEEEDCWVKTECDEEMLRNQRAINVLDFQQSQLAFLEDMAEVLEVQKQRYNLLFEHYDEKVSEWKALMEEVYEERQRYVEETNCKIAGGTSVKGSRSKKK